MGLKTNKHHYSYMYHNWLVVWNMNFMTFHSVGNVIIPTDQLIFFRGVGIPPSRKYWFGSKLRPPKKNHPNPQSSILIQMTTQRLLLAPHSNVSSVVL